MINVLLFVLSCTACFACYRIGEKRGGRKKERGQLSEEAKRILEKERRELESFFKYDGTKGDYYGE